MMSRDTVAVAVAMMAWMALRTVAAAHGNRSRKDSCGGL